MSAAATLLGCRPLWPHPASVGSQRSEPPHVMTPKRLCAFCARSRAWAAGGASSAAERQARRDSLACVKRAAEDATVKATRIKAARRNP
eukprot:CAMPEP_0180087966 /NCGR_PEP_ID=MMETSP0985-20121206/22010_1 /TAXON_ID=483367 /ORGANISM="non described non described, Strain CCMP 2436" /LENGTH=88 /DNA_ID=CAMNT_0022022397 /DNA_START=516 /DNA_END=778 /DNA_ORIENTATION=-